VRLTKKVATLSRWAFACSGVPTTGIISNGIDYFLFFFYSQVIGLSAALTGLALAIALTFDAVSNPLVGYLSDTCRITGDRDSGGACRSCTHRYFR
jgi:Na+/melibiose symporter-like transporter